MRGPNENSDRGDHFGTPFVQKTWKIRPAIGQNVGKVDFSKIPKDFRSCKGPFSHRNPVQRIGFILKFPWMVLISPNLPPGIETCRKFQPNPEKRDSLTSTQSFGWIDLAEIDLPETINFKTNTNTTPRLGPGSLGPWPRALGPRPWALGGCVGVGLEINCLR